jgi:hypothetical protein
MAEEGLETFLEVTNRILSRRSLERATIEGDSPVGERVRQNAAGGAPPSGSGFGPEKTTVPTSRADGLGELGPR